MSLANSLGKTLHRVVDKVFGGTDSAAFGGGGWAGVGSKRRDILSSSDLAAEAMSSINGICVDTIADDLSAIPIEFYRDLAPKNGKAPAMRNRATRGGQLVKTLDTWEPLDTNHPAMEMLENPNPLMPGSEMRYLTAAWVELSRGAVWVKVRTSPDSKLEPVFIYPFPRHWFEVEFKGLGEATWKFKPEYQVTLPDGKTPYPPMAARDVIYFRRPNAASFWESGRDGTPTLSLVEMDIDLDYYISMTNLGYFVNGGVEGSVIQVKQWNRDFIEKWKQDYEIQHAGIGKAHRNIILPVDWTMTPNAVGKREFDFAQAEIQRWRRIMMGYKVPPAVLGDVAGLLRANVEAANYTYELRCLTPRIRRFCQVLLRNFITEWERGSDKSRGTVWHCAYEPFVTKDRAAELAERNAKLGAGTGVMTSTPNEVREEDGEDPYPDPKADKLYIEQKWLAFGEERPSNAMNVNMPPGAKKPAGVAAEEETDEEDEQDEAKSVIRSLDKQLSVAKANLFWRRFVVLHEKHERALVAAYKPAFVEQKARIIEGLRRIYNRTLSETAGMTSDQARAHARKKDIAEAVFPDAEREAHRIYEATKETLRGTVDAGADSVFRAIGSDETEKPAINEEAIVAFILFLLIRNALLYNATTAKELRELFGEVIATGGGFEELLKAVEEEFDSFAEYRIRRMARLVTTGAWGWASQEAALELAKLGKRVIKSWVGELDDSIRPAHERATEDYRVGIPVEDDFIVMGEYLSYPGDPKGSIDNTANCRCVPVFQTVDLKSADSTNAGNLLFFSWTRALDEYFPKAA